MSKNQNLINLIDIDWDCDDPEIRKQLPKNVSIRELDLPDYVFEEIEEAISDILAEKYGYCHNGYNWEFSNTGMQNEKTIEYYRYESMEYTPKQDEYQRFKTHQGIQRAVKELKDEFGFDAVILKMTVSDAEYQQLKFNPFENTNPIMKATLNTKVLDWYHNEYPTDNIFDDKPSQKAFKDVEFRNLIGITQMICRDSVARNRIIGGLAEASGIKFNRLYDTLMSHNNELYSLQDEINHNLQKNTRARHPGQNTRNMSDIAASRQKAQQDFAKAMKKSKGRS